MRSASVRQSAQRANPGAPRVPNRPASARSATQAWRSAVPAALCRAQAGLAHGLGDLAHLLAAAAAVLDDALEEVRRLLLPVDAGEGLAQRRDHGVFHAVVARGGEALDDHRLQALDHHAAAHLGGAGHAEVGTDLRRGKAQAVEHGLKREACGPPSSSGTLMR
jgi:hypothetical protein